MENPLDFKVDLSALDDIGDSSLQSLDLMCIKPKGNLLFDLIFNIDGYKKNPEYNFSLI